MHQPANIPKSVDPLGGGSALPRRVVPSLAGRVEQRRGVVGRQRGRGRGRRGRARAAAARAALRQREHVQVWKRVVDFLVNTKKFNVSVWRLLAYGFVFAVAFGMMVYLISA